MMHVPNEVVFHDRAPLRQRPGRLVVRRDAPGKAPPPRCNHCWDPVHTRRRSDTVDRDVDETVMSHLVSLLSHDERGAIGARDP